MTLYKYLLLCAIALVGCRSTFAQKQLSTKMKTSQVLISIDNGLNVNKVNIKNNDLYPNPIQAPSMLSYKPAFAIEYQRITSYGLIFGGGFTMGSYSQNFDVVYDSFDFVDTTRALKESTAKGSFRNTSMYAGLRLFVGYTIPVGVGNSHSYNLETKMGISKRIYFSGSHFSYHLIADYESNDTTYLYRYNASSVYSRWGNNEQSFAGPIVFDFYLGLRRDITRSFINSINIGVYGTFQFHLPGIAISDRSDALVRNGHYLNGAFLGFDDDHYTNREIVFGIKIGMGLKL